MKKRLFLLLLPVLLLAVKGKAEYFIITNYQVTINFAVDGSADFEEIIEVQFSEPRHGITRFIPYRSKIDGKKIDRIIKEVKVDGFKFKTYKENYNMAIRMGDADKYVDGRQVYRIHYKVLNPLNFFKVNTEFYWDLLGISWETVTENFSYRLVFPASVNLSASDVRSFTGSVGSQGHNISIQVQPREIIGKSIEKFMPYEGATVAVNFPFGTFQEMSSWADFLAKHALLLVAPLFLIVGIIAKYIARNKRQTIMTEYFPPTGVSPAVAGGFVDHSVDNSDVLCLIPHLANQGYLRMEVEEGKGFLQKDKITFYKLKEAGTELFAFEKDFFNALFATGDQVELKHLKDKFYMHMSGVKVSVKEWIKLQGWYEADQRAMGCVVGLGGLVALAWGGFAVFKQQNLDGIALIVVGFLLFFFASQFNKRSPLGNKTFQKFEGFRQFVKKAERPVIERLLKEDPMYYDKTMPFALAFGYLKQWNHQFEGLLSQPPSWYGAPGMHGASLGRSWSTFSESFPSEINNVGSVFSSSPSSSGSGGGGGGGGFSGGGSGGGGGSSW